VSSVEQHVQLGFISDHATSNIVQYILNNMQNVNIFYILTTDLLLLTVMKDKPVLSSERAPHMDRTVTVK
jgi:hypothetical protein